MKKKLIVLGSSNVDYILKVPHFLLPGETLAGDQYQVALGGKGANQAVAAGRAGANITFIAAVGDDDVGKWAITQFQKDQINTALMTVIKGEKTGVALIFVNHEGENMIGIYAGANAHVTPELVTPFISEITAADMLLMQLETPIETLELAAEKAKNAGVKVVLNPAPARDLTDAFLANIDIITPNETEAQILTGITVETDKDADLASQALHQKGIETVIITLGKRGAWVSVKTKDDSRGTGELVPGFMVKAVDTIGAGDTFNGALVTALLEDQTLFDAVKIAHAAGALAVMKEGAQPAIPWREEIEAFLKAQA
ncbi:ribokinase [Ignatzschineria rhizosphaerae]|uniref:Ribokinase n=1 Tax=Ignatzschineria rhizosphaerae TaxID=2923279 RepID=A0ABY3WYR6_9GAMM|nr:ribokinase [Ignatzschineria rhizosphaerae]UNM95756.1 ribokinase [Ignatzschineria rhizosphaerae]